MAWFKLTGLKAAGENLKKLDEVMQNQIANKSLRELGWALTLPMRSATYTTFNRQDGYIKSGLSVAVERDAQDGKLKGWVVEYPQRIPAKRRKSKSQENVAFWWRFLEFGTHERRRSATPKFIYKGKMGRTAKVRNRQAARKERWLASASTGGVRSRSWLRPAFAASEANAAAVFRDTVTQLTDAAVNAMAKKGD